MPTPTLQQPAPAECAVIDCDDAPVTVLGYSTCPGKKYLLCEAHRRESLAWIRGRWGENVTITEQPTVDLMEG